MTNHPLLSLPKPLVMSHRGGMGLWPPNTIYAFHRSIKLGVDVLEMDIHLTKDKQIVVRHDPTVDATTNGSGEIKNLTLEEIKALDAGYTWTNDGGKSYPFRDQGITIPTLEEVLSTLPDAPLNIDIKSKNPAAVPLFAKTLSDYERLDNVLVGSFHDKQLAHFRELCPYTATIAGIKETFSLFILSLLRLERVYKAKAAAVQPSEYYWGLHVVTKRFVRAAHAHHTQVHIWTVNKVENMQRLLSWGVDGLITDYPDRLMHLLNRSTEKQAA